MRDRREKPRSGSKILLWVGAIGCFGVALLLVSCIGFAVIGDMMKTPEQREAERVARAEKEAERETEREAERVTREAKREAERVERERPKPPPPPVPPPAEEHRTGVGEVLRVDGLAISVGEATITNVVYQTPLGARLGDGKTLVVTVYLQSLDATKRYHYRTWRDSNPNPRDNFGNRYAQVISDFGLPAGARTAAGVTSEIGIGDVLVFERPLAAATYLDLDLPAKNVGKEGVYKFRIATKDIQER